MVQVVLDRGDEGGDALEGDPPDAIAGDLAEPALDEVEPAAVGRGEVQDEPRVAFEPAFDRRGLVGGVVVHDHVHGQVGGHDTVNLGEEAAELLGISDATAEEDWTYARAWLKREWLRGQRERKTEEN